MIKIFTERRRFKRSNIPLPVYLQVIESVSSKPITRRVLGNLRNLAPGGVCVELNTVIIDGVHLFYDVDTHSRQQLELTLETPDEHERITFQGQIRWYDRIRNGSPFMYVFGVEITNIAPEERDKLYQFLSSLK